MIAYDPYQAYDFEVRMPGSEETAGGFTTATLPDFQIQIAEYKTTMMRRTQKYPGGPAIGDATFSRGLFRNSSSLWQWIKSTANVGLSEVNEYRQDVEIIHKHRSGQMRIYQLKNCFPTNLKFSDLDANASDIAVEELT